MLHVIGAGYPRTGTYSLRAALITLLGGDCYHMRTVNENPSHVRIWQAAIEGDQPDWNSFLADYTAAVDWPVSGFCREIAAAFPEALVLLSARQDADTWWRSFDQNILPRHRSNPDPEPGSRLALGRSLLEREIGKKWDDAASAKAAYERHLEAVTAAIPPQRLIRWQPDEGWPPLCQALEVPIPTVQFPYLNTTAQRRRMT